MQLDPPRSFPRHDTEAALQHIINQCLGALNGMPCLVCLDLFAQEHLDVVRLGGLLGIWKTCNDGSWSFVNMNQALLHT